MSVLIVPDGDDEPWPTLGPQVCDLLEERAVHGPGDLRGKPYVLDDEKRALIYRAYEVYPRGHSRAGKRRFKRVAVSLRKGTAKTEWAAAIVFAELHPEAPVRCDGFRKVGGAYEPVGVPVNDPYIPMVAYTEEQTEDLAYAALYVMITEGPDVDLFDPGLERIMRAGGDGKAVALAAAPDSRDGARTTCQHFDETHRFVLPRLRDAHQTMIMNIPKRPLADPWSLETTTSFQPGEQSVAEGTRQLAQMVADGKAHDRTFFFFHREAPPRDDEDLSDPAQIRAAVVEASGPSIAAWPDFDGQVESICATYAYPDTDKAYWERVWLNRSVASARQAFDVNRWDELADGDGPIPDGELVTVGFDGARFDDSTGFVLTDVATGRQQVFAVWETDGSEDWEVPEAEVDDAMDEIFDRWQVWRVYPDPPYWETSVDRWVGKYGEKRVVAWWTHRPRATAHMIRGFKTAQTTGALSHDGNPDYRRHIANARRRTLKILDDEARPLWVIEKERPDSPLKIDLDMAGALSWQAYGDAVAAGARKRSQRMVIRR